MPDLFKEVLPSLMENKKPIFENDNEIDRFFEKNSYIINKAMSMHLDCVLLANLMNLNYHIDGKLKYDFYINTIRAYKRKFNYVKKSKIEDLDIIKEYYCVSNEKAKDYLLLLTRDNINEIKRLLQKGGIQK